VSTILKDKNGNTVFEATSPGKVLGSKAVYKKTINSRGNTIDYLLFFYCILELFRQCGICFFSIVF
jgi:hypothetical protein